MSQLLKNVVQIVIPVIVKVISKDFLTESVHVLGKCNKIDLILIRAN